MSTRSAAKGRFSNWRPRRPHRLRTGRSELTADSPATSGGVDDRIRTGDPSLQGFCSPTMDSSAQQYAGICAAHEYPVPSGSVPTVVLWAGQTSLARSWSSRSASLTRPPVSSTWRRHAGRRATDTRPATASAPGYWSVAIFGSAATATSTSPRSGSRSGATIARRGFRGTSQAVSYGATRSRWGPCETPVEPRWRGSRSTRFRLDGDPPSSRRPASVHAELGFSGDEPL